MKTKLKCYIGDHSKPTVSACLINYFTVAFIIGYFTKNFSEVNKRGWFILVHDITKARRVRHSFQLSKGWVTFIQKLAKLEFKIFLDHSNNV